MKKIASLIDDERNQLSGKVIAIVYSFENEQAEGFTHYEFWKSNVISAWLTAIEELGCKPYILDVRTFMLKISMGTMPHIDYCINLNAGNTDVNNLCLVPSLSSFINVPCIPCSAKTCAVGEDKVFANFVAQTGKMKLPNSYPSNVEGGIIRDRNLGSSIGIKRTTIYTRCSQNEVCQEFIKGTDMTIPVLFNPLSNQLEVLPPIVYKHNNGDEWFLDEQAKKSHSYEKILASLTEETNYAVLELAKKFNINTFCRIDTRVVNYNFSKNQKVDLKDIYFIEINPTPTINNSINFAVSVLNAPHSTLHKQCFETYKSIVKNATITGYILFCSLMAIKARRYQLQD